MATEMSAPEQWFIDAIKDGLKALAALRLDGTPAVDLLATTRDIWIVALWSGRQWIELDRDRLDRAFVRLASDVTRWPSPAELKTRLPRRESLPALAAPPISDAQRAENLARIRSIVAEVLGG